MSVVVRKFVTPWATWSRRWTDARMVPYQVPLFVADLARAGVLVGPYLSERWELRDEFVRYPGKFGASEAARELNVRDADLVAARPWALSQGPLVGDGMPELEAALAAARAGDLGAYKTEILRFVRGLCDRVTKAKAAAPVSPEFQGKLDERSARVDSAVRALHSTPPRPKPPPLILRPKGTP